jgi:hypothetical protein
LELKINCLLPKERHAVLLIDEMAIKPVFQFDNNSGEIIGMKNLRIENKLIKKYIKSLNIFPILDIRSNNFRTQQIH